MTNEDRDRLIQLFLPRLDFVMERRRPIRWLMMGLMCFPFLLVMGLVVCLWIREFDTLMICSGGALLGFFVMLGALAFVYLGKIQACDDILEKLRLSILLCELNDIKKSMSCLECLGKMDGVMKDMLTVVGQLSKQPEKDNESTDTSD